jgi:NAD(P)-dependent dehydrogenase (short-subunit alcohol dehydrogenase family)
MARLARGCTEPGTRVAISNQLDRSGEAILCASVETATAVEDILADTNRNIEGKVVLITGANGGIGRELIAAFKKAGAAEVIAATRSPVEGKSAPEPGVRHIVMDVTDPRSVEEAAGEVGARVDILVNNAGTTAISGFFESDDISGARREMEVNYFGTLSVIRAFAPHMKARRHGVIVNVLTALAHVCLPSMGSYCASKAAALSLTQGVRAELIPWGIRVCAIFPTTVDTAASADSAPPKLAPKVVAGEIVRMIRDGEEDVYPGNIAQDLIGAIRADAKAVEREMSHVLPEPR